LKLVIIAGGKGTRLGMNDIPKPMISIGGKPLLEHQIILAKKYGIRDIYILSGYLSEVIVKYFGDGKDFGVQITHIVEQQSLGTAGAVKQIQGRINDRFLVFYGDILMDFDIAKFREFDALAPAAATIIVHPNDHPYDSDLVEVDGDDIVTAFHSKLRDTSYFYRNLVNAAVYIFGPEVFRYLPDDRPTDFGKDIFPLLLKSGEKIRAYNTAEYVKDIGTPERFRAANDHFTSGRVARMSKRHKRPAIFLDRDGTLVKDVHLLHQQEQLELYPFSGRAVKKVNDSDYLCLLITNQPVVARNLCDESGVRKIHNKLETLLAEEGAYLDDIYFCPHHPDRGYPGENPDFKIDCECRKPKTGMVDKAAQEFNLDLAASWLIGDTTTDLQTGKNAGMRTILLRTGKGGKDGKFDCAADFTFDHLEGAVDFILEGSRQFGRQCAESPERLKAEGARSSSEVK
jgi:mannose-1-phosphate guanylyltransferase/phosphomannomutase